MENFSISLVTCPACQKDGEFKHYKSINITKFPKLRNEIMSRNIFTYICPHCGEKITVAYDCIYTDTENRFCVALLTSDESCAFDGISVKDYTVRIVHSINDFIEKISLFEDGIDDRVCELCKLFLEESYEKYGCNNYEAEVRSRPHHYVDCL